MPGEMSVQVASAIQAAHPGTHVASASNEAVASGAVNLGSSDLELTTEWIMLHGELAIGTPYVAFALVFWILGRLRRHHDGGEPPKPQPA